MGLSGEQYDRFNREYSPNRDRRMAEWRQKKDAERKEELGKQGAAEAERTAKSEETPTIKKITTEPLSSGDGTLLNAINNSVPGTPASKPQRRKKPSILHPTLFDEVN